MLKAELHIHTKEDKFDKIKYSAKELIDHLAKNDYKVLVITCHDTIIYSKELKDYAKSKDIILIPGCELWINKKHIAIINWQGNPKEIKTFDDLKKIKNKNNIILAPHPFFGRSGCLKKDLEKHINLFDAIEYCHLYNKLINRNKKAAQIAKKYNKPLIGTSDAHYFFQIGHTYTLINSKKDIKSIILAIKQNKVKVITKPLSNFNFLRILSFALFNDILHPILAIKKFKYVHFDKK